MAKPSKITASRSDGTLTIVWADGHESVYPLSGLRAACPCAECRGGHSNMGGPGSPDMLELPLIDTRSTEMVELQRVGNYALQIIWQDGHRAGIYSWDYLRELCPCDICTKEGS